MLAQHGAVISPAARVLLLSALLAGCSLSPAPTGAPPEVVTSPPDHDGGRAPGGPSISSDSARGPSPRGAPPVLPEHSGGSFVSMATEKVSMAVNLDARRPVSSRPFDPDIPAETSGYSVSVDIADENGAAHPLVFYFAKTGPATWDYHALTEGADVEDGASRIQAEVGSGTLAFDATGALVNVANVAPIAISFRSATSRQAIGVHFGLGSYTSAQKDAVSVVLALAQDGHITHQHVSPAPSPPAGARVDIAGNLDAWSWMLYRAWDPRDPSSTSNAGVTTTVRDTQGVAQPIGIYFVRTACGAWDYHALIDGARLVGGTPGTNVEVGSGSLTFTYGGALNTVWVDTATRVSFVDALPDQPIALSFGAPIAFRGTGRAGVTQFTSPSMIGVPGAVHATVGIVVDGNLDADAPAGTTVRAYDPLTTGLWVAITFAKTDLHRWSYAVEAAGSGVLGATSAALVALGSGELRFDSDGMLSSTAILVPLTRSFPGADPALTADPALPQRDGARAAAVDPRLRRSLRNAERPRRVFSSAADLGDGHRRKPRRGRFRARSPVRPRLARGFVEFPDVDAGLRLSRRSLRGRRLLREDGA